MLQSEAVKGTEVRLEAFRTENGRPEIVLFNSMGYRQGYVGVPKESPLYGKQKQADDLNRTFRGAEITWSDASPFLDAIVAEQTGADMQKLFYIGFDTGYSHERRDFTTLREVFGDEAAEKVIEAYHYNPTSPKLKDAEYCMGVCDALASAIEQKETAILKSKDTMEKE